MFNVPKKIEQRFIAGIKTFQSILANAASRDLNESDTVRVITDILSDVLGYDKYSEITSEHLIKGTFCDLCIKVDNKVQLLIEAKAIGIELKSSHIKQAVDYAANQGVEWVMLTNGIQWKIFKVFFEKPINQELVVELDFMQLNPKTAADISALYLISKEGWTKVLLDKYHTQKQALNKYYLGAILLTPLLSDVIRREIRKISPDVKVTSEQIQEVIQHEVIKREVLEGEKFAEAQKTINKVYNKLAKQKRASSKEVSLEEDTTESQNIDPASTEKTEPVTPNYTNA